MIALLLALTKVEDFSCSCDITDPQHRLELVQAADRPRDRRVADHAFYEEFDVRVTPARDAWVKEYAAKPDEACHACGYDPQTLADLRDHIIRIH